MAKSEVAWIPNLGAMSDFIGAFDVPSKVTDYVYRCRFSHCWNGIATRLAHPGFVEFQGRTGRDLSDREASYVGAEYLRERLEQEDEHALYDVATADVGRIIQKLGIR